jgi:hypothetical protein
MATITFNLWWTMGNRTNVHDMTKARSAQYTTSATVQDGEIISYRELLQRQSKNKVSAAFWNHYEIHRYSVLDWNAQVPIANHSLAMVAKIGHWSSQTIEVNPLAAFGEGVWRETK